MAQISRSDFDKLYQNLIADNTSGTITPESIRTVFDNLSDSTIWFDESTTGPIGSDGASAYDVAVANGFSGTATEWLTSLIGAPGRNGEQGPAGLDGKPGEDGRTIRDVRIASSTTFTVSDAEDGVVLRIPSGGAQVTLPDDASAALRDGFIVHLLQDCDESVSFEAAAGVKLDVYEGYLPRAANRGRAITAVKIGADRWRVSGDLAPAPDMIPFASGGAVCHVRTETDATTLKLEDAGGLLEVSASNRAVVTLPSDTVAAIPCGAVVHIAQGGIGPVAFAAGTDATLLVCATKSHQVSGQHGVVRAIKSAPNTWRLTGDLADIRAFA